MGHVHPHFRWFCYRINGRIFSDRIIPNCHKLIDLSHGISSRPPVGAGKIWDVQGISVTTAWTPPAEHGGNGCVFPKRRFRKVKFLQGLQGDGLQGYVRVGYPNHWNHIEGMDNMYSNPITLDLFVGGDVFLLLGWLVPNCLKQKCTDAKVVWRISWFQFLAIF